MTGTFSISKEDYLTFLLFDHSKSKEKKRKLIILWVQIIIVWIILTLLLYSANYPLLTFFSFILGIYYSLLFPFRQPRSYKKYYEDYIDNLWQRMEEKKSYIELTNDSIFMSEDTMEFRISTSEVVKITDMKEYFFLFYRFGGTLILPKKFFSSDILLEELLEISRRNFIKIDSELNWRWGIKSLLF